MEDIAPKLLEKIQQDFREGYTKSKKIKSLKSKLDSGIVSHKDSHSFAIEVGKILSQSFEKNLSSRILPDGKLYYNISDRIIRPALREDFDIVSKYATEVQSDLNKKSRIGIKAIPPELNEDKVQGIIDITSGKEKFDDIAYMLGEPIVNFTQAIIDDIIKANAEFQYRSGLSPKIIRTSSGKCCEWCDKIAGTYEYENVRESNNDVFKRHRACVCLVEFVTDKKQLQNVHSQKIADKKDIDNRIKNSFTKSQLVTKKTKEQAMALEEKLRKEMSVK